MGPGGDGEVDKLRALEISKGGTSTSQSTLVSEDWLEGAGFGITIRDSIRPSWHHYYPLSGGQYFQMYVDTFRMRKCGEYTTSASFV